ncbi:MAG: hypothetical protein R6U10_05130, partial [Thermoplasmatota archaeon]
MQPAPPLKDHVLPAEPVNDVENTGRICINGISELPPGYTWRGKQHPDNGAPYLPIGARKPGLPGIARAPPPRVAMALL